MDDRTAQENIQRARNFLYYNINPDRTNPYLRYNPFAVFICLPFLIQDIMFYQQRKLQTLESVLFSLSETIERNPYYSPLAEDLIERLYTKYGNRYPHLFKIIYNNNDYPEIVIPLFVHQPA